MYVWGVPVKLEGFSPYSHVLTPFYVEACVQGLSTLLYGVPFKSKHHTESPPLFCNLDMYI